MTYNSVEIELNCMSKQPNLKLVVHESVDELSPQNLQLAYQYIKQLAEQEKEEATNELLEIPSLLEDIQLAKQDVTSGDLTDWREVRKR